MKKAKWMAGSILGALMVLPIACGGQDTDPSPQPEPTPEGRLGEAEGAWGVDLVSSSVQDCMTNLLFQVSAAEQIGFVAVEAAEELRDQLQYRLLTVNEQQQLVEVAMTAVRASSLVRNANATALQAASASESRAAATTAAERSVADRHSFVSATSEAVQESAASRKASANQVATATSTFVQEHDTIVDQVGAAEQWAGEQAAQSAFQSFVDWGGLGLAVPFGGLGGLASGTASEAAEVASAAQAAQVVDLHFRDRALVSQTASQTAAANEFVAEEAAARSAIATQDIAEVDETAVLEASQTAAQEATAFSETFAETAESVYEALSTSESIDQRALESMMVFVTEELALDQVFVEVSLASEVAEQIAATTTSAEAANVRVLSGTTGGVFANALFPNVLACL